MGLTCTTTVSTMAFTTAVTVVFITDTHLTPLTLDTEELIPMLIMVSILMAITVMVSTPTLLPSPPLLQPLPLPQAKNKPKDKKTNSKGYLVCVFGTEVRNFSIFTKKFGPPPSETRDQSEFSK